MNPLVEHDGRRLPRTETSSLLGDLKANARLVQRTLTDPRQGALFKAVIAAATCDARTADALHRFYDIRITEWAPCVQQAIDRGEVPEGTDTYEVIRAVSAPLYYRLLTSGDPLDETTADHAAEAAAAARAPTFRRSHRPARQCSMSVTPQPNPNRDHQSAECPTQRPIHTNNIVQILSSSVPLRDRQTNGTQRPLVGMRACLRRMCRGVMLSLNFNPRQTPHARDNHGSAGIDTMTGIEKEQAYRPGCVGDVGSRNPRYGRVSSLTCPTRTPTTVRSGVFAGQSEATWSGSRRRSISCPGTDLLPLQVSRFLRQIFKAVTSHHVGVIQSDDSQPVVL